MNGGRTVGLVTCAVNTWAWQSPRRFLRRALPQKRFRDDKRLTVSEGDWIMRDRLSEDIKNAMRSGQKERLGTLRLLLSAIKDREMGIGTGGVVPTGPLTEPDYLQVLQKMVKQRRDSIETYLQGGRKDLADKEAAEISVLEEYMPKQMSEDEARSAVAALIKEVGASGPKDMGKVMGALKAKFAGQMDFGKASAMVKELLK
jgi:uncharacterized protein YqeY